MAEQIIFHKGFYLPMFLAGVSIMSGVSLKNTGEKLWGMDLKMAGMILFVGGWLLAIYSFKERFPEKWKYVVPPVVGIVAAAMLMNMKMKNNEPIPGYLPGLFILSWLYFVHLIATESGSKQAYLAAFLVFLTMLWLIPKEREAGVADGIGMPLFLGAFVLLANSMA